MAHKKKVSMKAKKEHESKAGKEFNKSKAHHESEAKAMKKKK